MLQIENQATLFLYYFFFVYRRQSLTNQLREREEDGILERTVFPEIPPRVEYKLTEVDWSLMPVINEMSKWGLQYVNPGEAKS